MEKCCVYDSSIGFHSYWSGGVLQVVVHGLEEGDSDG